MAKAGVRFRLGIDIVECICGEFFAMGQKCRKCGRTNADVLAEKAKPKVEKTEQSPKRKSKYREPASKGEFIESYLFKKK